VTVLSAGCASQPDHFYTLSTLPEAPSSPAPPPTSHVILSVTVPATVDRRELVIDTSDDQVEILEHERWSAPLDEQVMQALSRDIERRRPGVLVGDRGFDQPGVSPIRIKVDVVQMAARRGSRTTLEAHWRLVDAGAQVDEIGADLVTAPLDGEGYAAVASSFSACVSALAQRLAERIGALPSVPRR
jgi:uncharacterized lipoprotein YmbA